MYVAAVDSEVLRSDEMLELKKPIEKNLGNVLCLSIMPTLTESENAVQLKSIWILLNSV